MCITRRTPGRFPEDEHLVGVSTKALDELLDPFQGGKLISQSLIASPLLAMGSSILKEILGGQIAKYVDAVVDGDDNRGLSGVVGHGGHFGGVVLRPGGGSDDKATSIEPDHHGVPSRVDRGFVRQGKVEMTSLVFVVVEVIARKTGLEKSEFKVDASKRLRGDRSAPVISLPPCEWEWDLPKFSGIPDFSRFSKRFTDNRLRETSIRNRAILHVFKCRNARDVAGPFDLSELGVIENLRVGHSNCVFFQGRVWLEREERNYKCEGRLVRLSLFDEGPLCGSRGQLKVEKDRQPPLPLVGSGGGKGGTLPCKFREGTKHRINILEGRTKGLWIDFYFVAPVFLIHRPLSRNTGKMPTMA